MDGLKKPLFFIALALLAIAVVIEVAGPGLIPVPDVSDAELIAAVSEVPDAEDAVDLRDLRNARDRAPPGMAIRYLALVDGMLLFTVLLMAAGVLAPERIVGRVQGAAALIVGVLLLLGGVFLVFAAFGLLILMISLLTAVPFGTIAYMAIYGFFDRAGASALLGLVMSLKLGFAVCLLLAHLRFLQNRSLVLLTVTSFVATILIGFLHGFVPGFLVSITDALAAIIVGVLGLVWAVVMLVGAIVSIVKVLRVDRAIA